MKFNITQIEDITVIKNIEKKWDLDNSNDIVGSLKEYIENEKPNSYVMEKLKRSKI